MSFIDTRKQKFYDSGNSTEIPLGADGVFTGQWIQTDDYVAAIVVVVTDQDAAVDGLSLETSSDGVNVSHSHVFSPLANTPYGHHYTSVLDVKWFRVKYTNGSVAQSSFRLHTTLFKTAPEEGHVHPVEFEIDQDHPTPITRSILVARSPAGDYANIGRTTGGNLKVAVEEFEGEASNNMNNYPAGVGSNGIVTLTAANTAYAVPAAAPTNNYRITLQNNSDTDIYIGYQNTNANGIKLEPGDIASDNIGAGQQLYVYCASAGKAIAYTIKLVI